MCALSLNPYHYSKKRLNANCTMYHCKVFLCNVAGNSGAPRISSRGRPKFFEQHIPGAVVKPSESSRNRDIEASFSQELRGVCGF